MKLLAVTCRDRKVDSFGQPIFAQSRGAAIRSFSDEINRAAPENMLYQHPGDFDLYELGTYDTDTGKLTQHDAPVQIAIGEDLKQRTP